VDEPSLSAPHVERSGLFEFAAAVSGRPNAIKSRARSGKTAVARTAALQPMLSTARPISTGDST